MPRESMDQAILPQETEFQQYIKKMLDDLDSLNSLLDEELFSPDQRTRTQLNFLAGDITAYERVIEQLSGQEFDALMNKVQAIESKIERITQIAREKSASAGSLPSAMNMKTDGEAVVDWLEVQIPSMLRNLKNLEAKKSDGVLTPDELEAAKERMKRTNVR
ncbi:MAG: hypothetical protein A2744_03085 [Candidatus Buchananbacteria bacterium RIFCSPHIGHO2_01_FULL_44_11]|uniref:Uncharacterized protein n=1 Tax=Candidatus Buchananbacteria bacterium RIFCSPHIGHO2_01_FULL_44_11 TaxID=1797535 RepID=A0A1G1Y0C9_9BACT|nr:MAG: hypothetical protein A2744_03085 [Candidatus Buchananbacteria bacterium RIFCSPHIGHO2_01_FULL_44_11]